MIVKAVKSVLMRAQSADRDTSLALLVMRVLAGSAMTLHGLPKIVTPTSWMGDALPASLQLLAAVAEVGGGIAWILGLLTPVAAVGVGITMLVAIFFGHLAAGDPLIRLTVTGMASGPGEVWGGLPTWLVRADGRGGPGSGSGELALLFLAISSMLLFAGPGRFSLDARLAAATRKPAT